MTQTIAPGTTQDPAATPTPTVADALAAALGRHGIDVVFGQSIPTKFLLSAERDGVRQVFYRTENAGGAMADGFARVSGRVGVVTAQNGPAAALLVAPLAEALKASVPLLAVVQEVPRANRDRNAFQSVDHEALFSACAKAIMRLDEPSRIEEDVALALTQATSGRPGPVVVLVPRNVLALEAPPQPELQESLGRYPLDRFRPDRHAVRRAAERLADAASPLIIAGGGVHSSDAAAAIARLQDFASIPVATTTMGKGAVDEGHELSLGVVGSFMGRHSLTRSLRGFIQESDVVLFVGTRTNENGTDAWRLLPRDATYIHLDVAPEEIGRNYESLRLLGDARAGLEDIVAELESLDLGRRQAARPTVAERIAAAHEADVRDASSVRDSDAAPLRPERVMKELDSLLDPDTIVVADASYSTIWSAAFLRSRRPGQRFLSPRGLAGLGWGLPMAIGAQMARPDQRVVCIAGDGAFAHTWQELETVVRERLPIPIILLNNGILGFQKHAELYELGAHTSAVTFSPVDHAAIGRACGMTSYQVTDVQELRERLAAAMRSETATLLEVMIDPLAHPPITAWDDLNWPNSDV